MSTPTGWRSLDIAVIGGGIGGLSAAIALRRAGHKVTIYERADFAGEVGASISCAANGTRWLQEWGIDITKGNPVVIQRIVNHTWETGDDCNILDLADYEQKWGSAQLMFHRQDMHSMLMDSALGAGDGTPVRLAVKHKCVDVDLASGTITFEDGQTSQHDVVVGADGIGSIVRKTIGIHPDRTPSTSSCLHANVDKAQAVKLGLRDDSMDDTLEYWGGLGINKIVKAPCKGGSLLSFYCFFPRAKGDYANQDWSQEASLEELLRPFPDLNEYVLAHLRISTDIRPWRLWIHKEYPYWHKGVACIIGDASHPMMPDQAQGAVQSMEDAAALGIVFGKRHFHGDISRSLAVFEAVRKPRATRVQEASARARENITERMGFSGNTTNVNYRVADEQNKLTTEEMNLYDMYADVEAKAAALVDIRPSV